MAFSASGAPTAFDLDLGGWDGSALLVYFCIPLQHRAAYVGSNVPVTGGGGRPAVIHQFTPGCQGRH